MHWSKEKLTSLLLGLEIDDSSIGKCVISEVTSIEGEAIANNRKGKLIFFYELVIKCNWKGNVNGDTEEISGKLEIPNLSEENNANEVDVNISLDSSEPKGDILKNLMRLQGQKKIREQISHYITALRDEFAKDMIKPSKLMPGGSVNSFQTEAQLNNLNNSYDSTKNNSPVVVSQEIKVGVKIDTITLRLSDSFKCTAEEFYRALTDIDLLQAFTRNKVVIDPVIGGQFALLDGNIIGKFTYLEPNKCIKQNWRIKNWPMEHYSEVTINIEQKEDFTEVSIIQNGVPRTELERTEEGWKRHYFESIKRTLGFGIFIC